MRLATFNLMHGRSLVDGTVALDRLTAAVRRLDADVLALQEVDHGQPRSGGVPLTRIAAEALGTTEYRFTAAVVGTPGDGYRRASDHVEIAEDEPQFGVSLVSRFPVRAWHHLRLNPAPVRGPVWRWHPRPGVMLLRDEPRVAVAAELSTPDGAVTVASTHLSFVPGWNVGQLRKVARWLRGLPGPRFLLGDLNMPAGVAGAASGFRVLARRPTFPSPAPRIQLDHVLLDRRAEYTVHDVETPPVDLSDHRPLLVSLSRT